MKPPRSILDPAFRWVKPAHTDVGRHLRQWKREQRELKAAQAKADAEAKAKVAPIAAKKGAK